MNRRKIALTTPVMVMTGMPAIRKREIGEFWKMSFRRQGRIAAAIDVPRNVIAITPVAHRKMPCKLVPPYAHSALMTSDGTIIRISDPQGTRRLAEMLAADSGSTRSKAAAKITRVDERNRVPAEPKNHSA